MAVFSLLIFLTTFNYVCQTYAFPHSEVKPRLANGLAITPPMGWNSYNHYACAPTETIIHSNAQALIDLGLAKLGYQYVTTDCGWSTVKRTANGTLTWNPTTFPSGFKALGTYLHGLGLKFGVYSDSGLYMCDTSSTPPAGSLNHETTDADMFASWGADMIKFDNCYSEASTGYPDVDYTPPVSPSVRYATMAAAIKGTGREILFAICDWGVDFPSAWAPALGNTWRITNDIIPSWRTVFRQVNQIVPQTSFAKPGQWPDLDMLEVGNNVFTTAEEQTHFTLWAILKSPLTIGAALKDTSTSISASSLAILSNANVIGYNQDTLGVSANLTRRYSVEGLDVWAGPLSNGRTVAALVNWDNAVKQVQFNFPDFGIQSATTVKDIWGGKSASNVKTFYSTQVAAHGNVLLELSGTAPAGQYAASLFATTSGTTTTFSSVYGLTTSATYSLTITFSSSSSTSISLTIKTSASSASYTTTLAAGHTTAALTIPLSASSTNTIAITSPSLSISSITVAPPTGTFYPSTSFALGGAATRTTCSSGSCAPVGSRVGYLSPSASATLSIPRTSAATAGSKYVEVTYTNNEIAIGTSWTTGRNARNITVAVNGASPVRLEVPLSGRSSELFSPGLGWEDSATLGVLVGGWGTGSGSDVVVIGNNGGGAGVTSYAADFVGLRVYG